MSESTDQQNRIFNFDFEYSTVTEKLRGRGKYKRHRSGPGFYGDIEIEVSPLENSENDFQLIWSVDEDTIPIEFASGVIQGVRQWCAVNNYKDLKIEVVGGSWHEVDSNKHSYAIAIKLALNDAFKIENES